MEEFNREKVLETLLDLSEKSEIKFTPRQLKKMSDDRLDQVMREHEAKELDETNELITNVLIIKFEELMKGFDLIKEDSPLARKLQDRAMFKKDVKKVVGYFTPLLPFVGLIEGVVVTGSEIIDRYNENKNESSAHKTEKGEKSDSSEGDESEHNEG